MKSHWIAIHQNSLFDMIKISMHSKSYKIRLMCTKKANTRCDQIQIVEHFLFYNLFCLFVCLVFIVPLENSSLMWRRHHYWWRFANFDLCSALLVIEQRGFSSVPHLLWHGASVYNGHLRGPVTLTPIAEG